MRNFLGVVATGLLAAAPLLASLSPIVTESGKVRLSLDAAGTNNFNGRDIRVNKPSAAATVRVAYLAAASTGFTGYTIPNGGITLNGVGVVWDPARSIPNSIGSWNYWAVVTDIVRPTLNAAPPGITTFHVVENNTYAIDGEILAVIWDDPAAPNTTITLLYGAQNVNGDAFTVTLAQPVDKTNPQTVLDMSLGISYGYQPAGQYSILELGINGIRISTSAGGQDDGEPANGALITVGGIGDSNANPPDPYMDDRFGPRYDDELYNLLPFVANGATSFTVSTRNPSNDDNIFFAAIVLGANTAVVGEGILLSPGAGSANVGAAQSVLASVQSNLGAPIVGRTVEFEVISGPNLGKSGNAVTNASGIATWTYTSALAGVDTIEGSITNSSGAPQESNLVTRTWRGTNPVTYTITLAPDGVRNPAGALHTLTARVLNSMGMPVAGTPVTFTVVAGLDPRVLGVVATNPTGVAQLSYFSLFDSVDTIQASINIAGLQTSNTVQKIWQTIVAPAVFLSPGSATNPVNGRHTLTARVFTPPFIPVPGAPVVFTVIAGPNTGLSIAAATGFDGSATVSYGGNPGLDYIQASTSIFPAPFGESNIVTKLWTGLLCDVDNNGKIDILDIQAISLARNTLVLPGDVRDADFDGLVSATDARKCTLACTKPNCAQ